MWIVRLALRRPYTFVVVALLIAVLGMVSIVTMPTDIFPNINIPVVSIIWSYGSLSPTEMQDRITTVVEALTTTVNNIEHLESQSFRGTSVIKIYFQPGADANAGEAEVTALCQEILRPLPPGITPPLVMRYNAADVPVIQLSLGSKSLSQQEINDLGNSFIRTQLVTVRGRVGAGSIWGKIAGCECRSGFGWRIRAGNFPAGGHHRHTRAECDRLARDREDGPRRVRCCVEQQPRGTGRP